MSPHFGASLLEMAGGANGVRVTGCGTISSLDTDAASRSALLSSSGSSVLQDCVLSPLKLRASWVLAALPPLLGGCDVVHSGFLNAQGPVAAEERHLFMIVVWVMVVVILPVLLLTPLCAWHYRLANTRHAFRPTWTFSWVLELLVWVPPSLIVVGLGVMLWTQAREPGPYRAITSPLPALKVEAVALDWKWLFVYPQGGVATLNELDIPAGRPVHVGHRR